MGTRSHWLMCRFSIVQRLQRMLPVDQNSVDSLNQGQDLRKLRLALDIRQPCSVLLLDGWVLARFFTQRLRPRRICHHLVFSQQLILASLHLPDGDVGRLKFGEHFLLLHRDFITFKGDEFEFFLL